MSEKHDCKTHKKYQEAVQWRDWQTCDLICEEHELLLGSLKESLGKLETARRNEEKMREAIKRFLELDGQYVDASGILKTALDSLEEWGAEDERSESDKGGTTA